MRRPSDNLCPIGVQLIGDVGVEDQAGFRAILGIDLGVLLRGPPTGKRWPSDDEVVPSPQLVEKGRR